jgi:tetratricopeptide (TPR) repeat protein
LQTLGKRESGTEQLQAAVSAYREALKERTRLRVPLDWAITQNNLGGTLQTLGERETGTEQLQAAVSAYREALEIFEASGATHYIQLTKDNLDRAKKLIDTRSAKP